MFPHNHICHIIIIIAIVILIHVTYVLNTERALNIRALYHFTRGDQRKIRTVNLHFADLMCSLDVAYRFLGHENDFRTKSKTYYLLPFLGLTNSVLQTTQ